MTDLTELLTQVEILDNKNSVEAEMQYREKFGQLEEELADRFPETTASHYTELANRGHYQFLHEELE